MCLAIVVNGELCDLIEYGHVCFCALVNLVNCVLDDVLLYLYTWWFQMMMFILVKWWSVNYIRVIG